MIGFVYPVNLFFLNSDEPPQVEALSLPPGDCECGKVLYKTMAVLIRLTLLLVALLLLWPQPLITTIKRIMPALLVIAAVFCISICLQRSMDGTLTIKALGQRNAAAEGSEIWIKAVVIDGAEYAPEAIFSEGWINEDGYLKWRTYDQSFAVKDTISATFSNRKDIDILFDTNKWRGQVLVQRGHVFSYVIDCYSDSNKVDGSTVSYSGRKTLSGLRISEKALSLYIFAALFILAVISIFCRRKTEDQPKASNQEP